MSANLIADVEVIVNVIVSWSSRGLGRGVALPNNGGRPMCCGSGSGKDQGSRMPIPPLISTRKSVPFLAASAIIVIFVQYFTSLHATSMSG